MKESDKNLPIVFGKNPNQSDSSSPQQDKHPWGSESSSKQSGATDHATQQDAYDRGYQEGFDRARQERNTASNTSRPEGSEMTNKNFTYLLYGLFIGGYFTGGLTAIAALVLAYAKRADVLNTIYYSHMENIIHTFWMSLIVGLFACFLIFTFILAIIGWPLIGVLFVWASYRMLKGFLRVSDNRAYN